MNDTFRWNNNSSETITLAGVIFLMETIIPVVTRIPLRTIISAGTIFPVYKQLFVQLQKQS